MLQVFCILGLGRVRNIASLLYTGELFENATAIMAVILLLICVDVCPRVEKKVFV